MQGGNYRERRAPKSRTPPGAGEHVRDQLYQAHGGRIGSENSHTGDARIVRDTRHRQHERCDKFASMDERYARKPKFGRGRSPSLERSLEQERYNDRSLSRSRDSIHYDSRHAHYQAHRLSSGEEYRRSNGRRSLSPYKSSEFERSRGRRSDRENGNRDQWEPDERSRNWEDPNRNWNVSSANNNDSLEEEDDDGHRPRHNFDTRSHDRQRPSTSFSRNSSNSPGRYHNNYYGKEDEGNVYSSDEDMQDHENLRFTDDDPGTGRGTDKYYCARESREFENEFRYYNRNPSYRSPKLDRNSDAYERPGINLDYERDCHNLAPLSSLKLCTNSGSKTPESCDCGALHICKYFLLSKCLVPNCSFGHNLYTEHNEGILQNYFTQIPTIQQVKFEICKIENRNESTVPQICKFYNNEGGCKYEKQNNAKKCPCLHVCKYYVQKKCKFDKDCKRSHDTFSGRSLQLLRSYGLQPRNESHYAHAEILDLLDKMAVNSADRNALRQTSDNKKWIKGDIKNLATGQSRSGPENLITNNSDFIPLTNEIKVSTPRYFNFKDDSANDDDDFASEESLMLAKPRHGKKNKRKHRDDNKVSKKKRKKSRGQVDTNVNLAAVKLMGNLCTNDSLLDAKLGTNDIGPDAQIGRNDSRPDANFGTNDSGPDADLGTNDSGPNTNPGANDSLPDFNLETNDSGSGADLGDNDRCSALQTVGGQMDG